MARISACIIAILVVAAIAVPWARERRFQARWVEQSRAMQQLEGQNSRLNADNQTLSNSVVQFRRAQAEANQQFQELLRVRAELAQLKQLQSSNALAQEQAAASAEELLRLRQEVAALRQGTEQREVAREEKRETRAATEVAAADTSNPQPEAVEEPLQLRIIRTEGASFAEKLKKSVGARDEDSFQDVFGRFLQVNGIQTSSVAAAVYDERTGRVIVRAPQATLDQIEQLTSALDRAP